ncbi:MAG TPA: protein translocase subunit SecD [Candidatus Nanopelagicales bacterium]
MAAPTQKHTNPGRTLAILGLVVLVLGVWTFWPGQTRTPKLGLDLSGGTQVILTPTASQGGQQVSDDQLKQAVEIIRQRVDGFGVAESEVTTQGSGQNASIIVSIPGKTNSAILNSLATTAKLDFRPVLLEAVGGVAPTTSPTPTASGSASPSATKSGTASPAVSAKASAGAGTPSASASGNGSVITGALSGTATSPSPSASPTASASPSTSPSPTASSSGAATDAGGLTTNNGQPPIQSKTNDAALQAAFAALDCTKTGATKGGLADPTQYLVTCSKDGSLKYLLDKAAVRGTEIASASAGLSQTGGGWEVNLTFTSTGAQQFATVTGQLAQNPSPQNQFGIVLDGLVESSPYVSQAILGGSAVITGSFTADEAKALANVLKYGSLPVSLEVSSVEQVSPTLGQDQLSAGLLAGALGLLLVVIYLVVYYRALGLVATASLLVAAAITYFVFVILSRQLGLALSLAGVAGAIVAIGITADSFIVYFERIRDEIREGRSLRAAGDAGWIRARRTILAADFVSFLAAIVLYFLSVGSVRGFAFTLGLTTIVDVVVAFLFTRPLVSILMRSPAFTSGKAWTGLSPDRLGVKPSLVQVEQPGSWRAAGTDSKES